MGEQWEDEAAKRHDQAGETNFAAWIERGRSDASIWGNGITLQAMADM
jgi:hypothetical protein